jgi:hypothetical protein
MQHSPLRIVLLTALIFSFFMPFHSARAEADTWTETETSIYTTNPDKKIGIGTVDPQADLAVMGKKFVVGNNALVGTYQPEDTAFEFQSPTGSAYLNFISGNGSMVFGSSTYGTGQNGLYSWHLPFVFFMDGKESFRVASNGRVGIGGTANPQYQLDVTGGTSSGAILGPIVPTGSEGGELVLRNKDGQPKWVVDVDNGDDLRIFNPLTYAQDHILLQSNGVGNVGIGVRYPEQKLEVDGYVKATGVCIGTDCRTSWPVASSVSKYSQGLLEFSGTAQLKNGRVTIQLDPTYASIVNIDAQHPMQIFVQPYEGVNLYVKPGTQSFEVLTNDGRPSNATFAYRMLAQEK